MALFETLPYLAKVNFFFILFYACYWVMFRKYTFFKWNRYYLVFSLLLSLAIPLITLPEKAIAEVSTIIPTSIETYGAYEASSPIIVAQTSESFSWLLLLQLVYLIGASLMLFKLLEGIVAIFNLIRKSEQIRFEEYKLVLLDDKKQQIAGSFSFLNWLMVSQLDYEHHFDTILRHEYVHIQQRHSLDILLIELLKVAFWFNPILWFYKQSIQEVHEYLADEQAPNRNSYSSFLVSYTLNNPLQPLTNHFFNTKLLKKRIEMIYKNRTPRWQLSKYMLIAPLIGIGIVLTAARVHTEIDTIPAPTEIASVPVPVITPKKVSETVTLPVPKVINEKVVISGIIKNKEGKGIPGASVIVKGKNKGASTAENGSFSIADVEVGDVIFASHVNYQKKEFIVEKGKTEYQISLDVAKNTLEKVVVVGYGIPSDKEGAKSITAVKKIFTVVEMKPEFPGGVSEMYKFLARNIHYPTIAAKDNIQGTVIINFIVNEEGYIQQPKVEKGLGYGLEEEATRVVLKMPQWKPAMQNGKPVAVEYTLPVEFALESPTKKEENKQGSRFQIRKGDYLNAKDAPLYVLDGKVVEKDGVTTLENLNPDEIASINVFKGEKAAAEFGSDGKNGVIQIFTKSYQKEKN
mgnify:CR=1 FL=1